MPSQTSSRIPVFAALALLSAAASAQIYCYDEDNGRRVCAQSVPPEAARLDREIFNNQGVVIGHEQGEITPEEQQQIDEQRRRDEEVARQAEEQRRYGQMLLDSYSSVDDIETLRNRRIEAIQQQISIIENYLEGLDQKFEDLERRSQRFAPYSEKENAPPLPDNISLDIERTKSSIALFEQRLKDSEQEQVDIREDFERDIEYFRELKGEDA